MTYRLFPWGSYLLTDVAIYFMWFFKIKTIGSDFIHYKQTCKSFFFIILINTSEVTQTSFETCIKIEKM